MTAPHLREIFQKLVDLGAACLDLVTPTHFTPVILEALGTCLASTRGVELQRI